MPIVNYEWFYVQRDGEVLPLECDAHRQGSFPKITYTLPPKQGSQKNRCGSVIFDGEVKVKLQQVFDGCYEASKDGSGRQISDVDISQFCLAVMQYVESGKARLIDKEGD